MTDDESRLLDFLRRGRAAQRASEDQKLQRALAPQDDALVAAMAEELERCEAPFTLVLRPLSAFYLAGLLQLALLHPPLQAESDIAAAMFIKHVRAYFTDQHATAVLEALRRGDDPSGTR